MILYAATAVAAFVVEAATAVAVNVHAAGVRFTAITTVLATAGSVCNLDATSVAV